MTDPSFTTRFTGPQSPDVVFKAIQTESVFEISKKGAATEVCFTHRGLVPKFECFEGCSGAWGTSVGESLKSLIETGEGQPDRK